jgi:hypothetical protein
MLGMSCPYATIAPGQLLEVEIVQPDGGRALVVGKLDAVPEAAGGRALRIVVCDAQMGGFLGLKPARSSLKETFAQVGASS